MIDFEEVTKLYGHTTALDHVSVTLDKDNIYCLLGRNGAGKTTFLKLIAGHINATYGNVKVNNQIINPLKMCEGVSFIENTARQFNTKIKNLIKMASELDGEFDYEFAQHMVESFKLDGEKRYSQLSFGMKTMVTTLLNLSSNGKVVLLDEPVLGFDAIMRNNFYEMLNDSFEKHPRVIIVSTHLIDEIAKIARELIIIDQGKIIHKSTVDEIFEKAYSIVGPNKDIELITKGLNVIRKRTVGGHTAASIYDEPSKVPKGANISSMGLQDFFISMLEGQIDE